MKKIFFLVFSLLLLAVSYSYAATPEDTMTMTATPTKTVTSTPTYTATPTDTPTITDTPTTYPTDTPTITPTRTSTKTPTKTSTPTYTPTSTPTYDIHIRSWNGIYQALTTTSTTLSCTAIAGSANSTTAWTLVRGSDLGAIKWYLSEPSNTYDLKYSFNPVTYTINNDYGLWKRNTIPFERSYFAPSGIYVSVTFTTIYSGNTFSTTIFYEGQK